MVESRTSKARGLTLALSFTILSLGPACGGSSSSGGDPDGGGASSSSGGGGASSSSGGGSGGDGGVRTECPPDMQTGGPCRGDFLCNHPGPCTACGCCYGASECRDGVMVYLGYNDGCYNCGSGASSGGVGGGSQSGGAGGSGAGGESPSAGAAGDGGAGAAN